MSVAGVRVVEFGTYPSRFERTLRTVSYRRCSVELLQYNIGHRPVSSSVMLLQRLMYADFIICVMHSFILHDVSPTAAPADPSESNPAAIIEYSIQPRTGFSSGPSTVPY